MSLTDDFDLAQREQSGPNRRMRPQKKRTSPFTIRLSRDERSRLEREAAGAPLGTYIKAKALGVPLPMRRSGLAIEDRTAFARALALLGQSRLSNNLNQLTKLANVGALPFTPEIEEELLAALSDVRTVRSLLVEALGLREGAAP